MSNGGKVPPKDVSGDGKVKPPPSEESFLSLVALWDHPEGEEEKEVAEEVSEDQVELLQEQEEELKKRGEEIIRTATEEATRIEEEAYQKGFAQGEEAGQAAGVKKFDDAVQRMEALFAALESQLKERNERYEEELLLLVKTMVDRLVQHEVSTNPRIIQACLKQALSFVIEKSVVKVHLHPDDFGRVREASLGNSSLLEGKKRIELLEDGSVSEGGCFLETDFGDVDATLEHGRERLYEAVDQAFRASFAEEARKEVPVPPAPEASGVDTPAGAGDSAEVEPAALSADDETPDEPVAPVVPVESPEAELSDSTPIPPAAAE